MPRLNLKLTLAFPVAAILFAGYLYLSWLANNDLAEGRYSLFMDEWVSFDNIRPILHADHFVDFIKALIGHDQRYGRTLYYLSAIVAALPEALAGPTGQIIATRMFVTLTLVGALAVLSFGLVRNWLLSLLCFVSLMSLPFVDYFATLPKPEPLQLLFLAIFLVAFFAYQRRVGWPWLFFGLAFGAKISVVVIGPALALIAALARSGEGGKADAARSMGYFVLGWIASVPVLLKGVDGIRRYLNGTFLNTGHGADSPDINLIAWLDYAGRFLSIPKWHTLVFYGLLLTLTGLAAVVLLRNEFKDHQRTGWLDQLASVLRADQAAGVLIAACGLIMLASVMLGVHRIWGHYLFPGMALLVTGFFISADRLSRRGPVLASVAWLAVVGLVTSTPFMLHNRTLGFERLAQRTSNDVYIRKKAEYDALIGLLVDANARLDRRVMVFLEPRMFTPDNRKEWRIDSFYGAFRSWDSARDFVILYREHMEPPPLNDRSKTAIEKAAALDGFRRHTLQEGAMRCAEKPCYRVRELKERVRVLERVDP